MEIRKQIESLAVWYVPAFFIVLIASWLFPALVGIIWESGIGKMSSEDILIITQAVGKFILAIDNIVVGIWLFVQSKKENGKSILWLLFGLAAHFFAALLFVGLRIYEEQIAHNKSLKSGTPQSGAP